MKRTGAMATLTMYRAAKRDAEPRAVVPCHQLLDGIAR